LRKDEFWKKHAATPFNARQRSIINRLLDGFVGKLTSSKWAQLENTSPDTALRDINDLVARGILKRDEGGGRSTSYLLAAN
jgi:Fic family protein